MSINSSNRRNITVLLLASTVALASLAGARARRNAAETQPRTYQVNIQDFSFQPVALNVPIGATVAWTNKDEEPHTVFSNDDVFKSKALDTDETFSFKFMKAGTYKYFCSVHPKMVATIVVGSSAKKSGPATTGKMDGMSKDSMGRMK